jgi:MarR family transcriptional regulator for hemolysin
VVERRDDPQDRRAKCLYLTETGRILAGKIEALVVGCRTRLLESISDADLFATHRALSQLNEAVDRSLLSCEISESDLKLG